MLFFKKKITHTPHNIDIPELVKDCGIRHIAFIMDGNGRWATNRSLPREAGHSAGAKNFKTVVKYCKKIGIKYVTVYAFSTENWKRPSREIDAIMSLLDRYLNDLNEENDVEYKFIGDMSKISEPLRKRIEQGERETAGREYRLNIALNYGSRNEIVNAVNSAIKDGLDSVDEKDINDRLYTFDCPDPDLIVRTGNEYRISNFLLWQSAYSELYFTDRLWPDFSSHDVDEAIIDFSKRKRRFGGLNKS